jgi:hypothetical protein
MAVSQKIISGNDQPNGGRVVSGINGARALDSSSVLDSNHTQDPAPQPPAKIDQSIADINTSLDSRYDETTYYG